MERKKFKVSSNETLDHHETLPVATYAVAFDCSSKEFFLKKMDSFEIKGKLFGTINRYAERILNTFHDRTESSTGVFLTGEKGSGKTLLAKRISILAADQGIPTIVISHSWCGDDLNLFLHMIQQPVLVLLDEFEKVYALLNQQQKMLTLLDGIYASKRLFVLTFDDQSKLDPNLLNQPGRIYYSLDHAGLDKAIITEYCQDDLTADMEEHIPTSFNFAML